VPGRRPGCKPPPSAAGPRIRVYVLYIAYPAGAKRAAPAGIAASALAGPGGLEDSGGPIPGGALVPDLKHLRHSTGVRYCLVSCTVSSRGMGGK